KLVGHNLRTKHLPSASARKNRASWQLSRPQSSERRLVRRRSASFPLRSCSETMCATDETCTAAVPVPGLAASEDRERGGGAGLNLTHSPSKTPLKDSSAF